MRHDPFTGVFNGAYINNMVRFNVQDAFLESEISDDGLTRAFTHMSIRCNPGVPKEVPAEMMKSLLTADTDVVGLERQFKQLYARIKGDYKFIRCAPKAIRKQYEDVRKSLTNTKKSLKDEIEKEFRKDYFFRVHNEMMKKQLHRQSSNAAGDKEDDTPLLQYQLNERNQLQRILCDFSKKQNQQDIVSRKISAINLMVALASRQEVQTRKPRLALILKDTDKKESPAPASSPSPDEFPVVCAKTQCIICIGNERLSYEQRTRTFRRVAHMWDHVENVHLRNQAADGAFVCYHPICKAEGLVLDNMIQFKSHVARTHGIELRA
jgi:hypothetical protein